MRSLAAFIMRGRVQAVVAVAGLAALSLIIPLVSLFSAAALALVALRRGGRESSWVLLLSALSTGALGAVLTGSIYLATGYGLLLWVPVWLAALLLRESGRLALTLEAAVIVGVMAVLAGYLVIAEPAQIWQASLQRLIQPMLEHAPPGFNPEQVNQNLEFFSHYMSGIAVGGSIMGLILALLLARWWQSILFNPGGFKAEFVGLRLHAAMAYLTLGSIAVAVAVGGRVAEIAWNLNFLFLVLFLIGGFSIVHAIFASGGPRRFWLVGLYVAAFIIPQLLLPIVFLGLSDVWLNWRRRIPHA